MVTLISCRRCRVELAKITLGDRSAAIVCLDCDVITFEPAPRRGRRKRAAAKTAPQFAKRGQR